MDFTSRSQDGIPSSQSSYDFKLPPQTTTSGEREPASNVTARCSEQEIWVGRWNDLADVGGGPIGSCKFFVTSSSFLLVL